ncbi:hypothetical protein [Rhodoferax sp.]|uniref:hypothetical protein n=1 Tax=Rhodoferax sp. TaxID=50421 RepID=UPI0026039D0B|nr:hypothetical protein [Rhodoferax sp.]MDD2926145.1 hypothetical protein [Rhodoferax sp.]
MGFGIFIDSAGHQRRTKWGSNYWKPLVIATLIAVGGGGCTSSDKTKERAQEVINNGLSKQSECITANVGHRYDPTNEPTTLVLRALEAAKLIELGAIQEKSWLNNIIKDVPAYKLTEAGKAFVPPDTSASVLRAPCVRNGRFEVVSIEAIDINNDLTGQSIANVRARLKFVPEAWFASTKTDPAWVSYWSTMKKNEQTQWLYRLVKSGDDFFYTGRAAALN